MANWTVTKAATPEAFEAEQAERTAVFKKIANKENWKLPIEATIPESDLAECEQAAIFFTGGPIVVIARRPTAGTVKVFGRGYYHHIGA